MVHVGRTRGLDAPGDGQFGFQALAPQAVLVELAALDDGAGLECEHLKVAHVLLAVELSPALGTEGQEAQQSVSRDQRHQEFGLELVQQGPRGIGGLLGSLVLKLFAEHGAADPVQQRRQEVLGRKGRPGPGGRFRRR
jgi:hypothetical protein